MEKQQKLFLELISSALTGSNRELLYNDSDIPMLECVATRNFCMPLIYQGCVNNSIVTPPHWKAFATFTVMDSYRKLEIESEIINILKDNGIRSCVLKGSSVAMNYPNPLSRPMGDIDLLVDEHNYEKSALLFVSSEDFEKNKHDFHMGFNYKNVRIEIHKNITEQTDNKFLTSLLSEALDNVETKKLDSFDIPILTPVYQAVSLLTHMLRHFRDNEFVFRMLCDWTCFVKNLSTDVWLNDIYPILKKTNLAKFADAINKIASIYMNVNLERKVLEEIDDLTCELLLCEFLSENKSANINSIGDNIASMFSEKSTNSKLRIIQIFLVLNKIARTNYKLAKYSVFLPVFWFYIPIKYFWACLFGKKPKIKIGILKDKLSRKETLYKALDLKF